MTSGAVREKERQSSAKFHELAGIIAGLGETKRVLVVLPLKALLNDAQAKIAKLGVALAILQGGAMERRPCSRAGSAGRARG